MKYFDDLQFSTSGIRTGNSLVMKNYPTFYGVQFIYSGSIFLRIGRTREYHLSGPVVFLTCPELFFEYWNEGNSKRDHLWCCFHGPRVQRMIEGNLFPASDGHRIFYPPAPENFKRQMQNLQTLAHSANMHDQAVMCLENLLFQLRPDILPAETSNVPYRKIFEELLEEISANPLKPWDFNKEARKLSFSLNYFNRLFRQYCRTSPTKALLDSKMSHAAIRLVNTSCKVGEISAELGYDNTFYFSRLFKSRYKVSPQQFRKNAMEI